MSDTARRLFEKELASRGVHFSREQDTGYYVFEHNDTIIHVSLDNIARDYDSNPNPARIVAFVERVLSGSPAMGRWDVERQHVLLCLEPTDYAERPPLRTGISDQVDEVLVHYDDQRGNIVWISQAMLDDWGIAREEAESAAADNLAAILAKAAVQYQDIDDVKLGFIETRIPFKTALLLAPNLKEIVAPVLGWPLHAIVPDRDFLYLWAAEHVNFAGRVGAVVLREHAAAPYPLSTELFEISDEGIAAVGAFAVPEDGIYGENDN